MGDDASETPSSVGLPDLFSSTHQVTHETRSYKCPNCGGEFDTWSGLALDQKETQCPFCGLVKGEYGEQAGEFSAFLREDMLDKMQESDVVTVTDYTATNPSAEHDFFVSFTVGGAQDGDTDD